MKEKGELRQDTARVKIAVFKCQGVQCWTPEDPALYQVNIVLELSDKNNEKTYIRHGQKLGFRSLKRKNQQVFWNHKPVKLLGICYREPDFKMENWETVLRRDLELFKAAPVSYTHLEMVNKVVKKTLQSVIFLPYFISWVIVSAIAYSLFNYENGGLNALLNLLGMESVNVYAKAGWWKFIITGFSAWKGVGYGMVVDVYKRQQYACVIATIGPILLVDPFIQKYFAQGVQVGAVKG